MPTSTLVASSICPTTLTLHRCVGVLIVTLLLIGDGMMILLLYTSICSSAIYIFYIPDSTSTSHLSGSFLVHRSFCVLPSTRFYLSFICHIYIFSTPHCRVPIEFYLYHVEVLLVLSIVPYRCQVSCYIPRCITYIFYHVVELSGYLPPHLHTTFCIYLLSIF